MFKVGSRIFWTIAGDVVGIGTVVNIIPSGSGLHGLTLYEVEFSSDVRKTLHGSELKLIRTNISSCSEKNRLWALYEQAFNVYLKTLKTLVDAAGMMAHTEFEFLERKLDAARDVARTARKQVDKHSAEHHC